MGFLFLLAPSAVTSFLGLYGGEWHVRHAEMINNLWLSSSKKSERSWQRSLRWIWHSSSAK